MTPWIAIAVVAIVGILAWALLKWDAMSIAQQAAIAKDPWGYIGVSWSNWFQNMFGI